MTELSFVMSVIALALFSLSYFFNSKEGYLGLQLSGNVFLSFSYLLIGSYFSMVALLIGIARGVICYIHEKKNKKVPVYYIVGLCFASILSYVIINVIVLQSRASVWDSVYLFASCMYAITFAIRNLKVMRYVVLIPHSSAVAYNLLIHAPISSAISYGIELAVTVVAIIKYDVIKKKKQA